MSRWITVGEAAEYLACSEYTITELLRRGELEGRKFRTHEWRTRYEWCDQYMERDAA